MSDTALPPLPATELTAAQFWNVYYSGELNTLRRGEVYAGEYDRYLKGHFFPNPQPFRVARVTLAAYDYRSDPRFSIGVSDRLPIAMRMVLDAPTMRQDTLPNRAELRLAAAQARAAIVDQDYETMRLATMQALEDCDFSTQEVFATLDRMSPNQATEGVYETTRDIGVLQMERRLLIKTLALASTDPLIAARLMAVVENPYEELDVISMAVWALGRHNDKSAISKLTAWLAQPQFQRHSVAMERALQLLCSGAELIPLAWENEAEYWRRVVTALPSDWAARDAQSVFWEKRLRCAVSGGPAANALRDDEVLPVRLAAGGAAPPTAPSR